MLDSFVEPFVTTVNKSFKAAHAHSVNRHMPYTVIFTDVKEANFRVKM